MPSPVPVLCVLTVPPGLLATYRGRQSGLRLEEATKVQRLGVQRSLFLASRAAVPGATGPPGSRQGRPAGRTCPLTPGCGREPHVSENWARGGGRGEDGAAGQRSGVGLAPVPTSTSAHSREQKLTPRLERHRSRGHTAPLDPTWEPPGLIQDKRPREQEALFGFGMTDALMHRFTCPFVQRVCARHRAEGQKCTDRSRCKGPGAGKHGAV